MEDKELQVVPAGQFQIRVRRGDWEIEVRGTQEFVLSESNRLIDEFKAMPVAAPTTQPAPSTQTKPQSSLDGRGEKQQTLNEFFRQFKLATHQEKILVLGYWIELKQGQSSFTPEEILARYKEARELPPANIRRDIGNLVGKGFLRADKGDDGAQVYTFTNSGIREVEGKLS